MTAEPRKRLTPRKTLTEANALTNAIVDTHDDDDAQAEKEEQVEWEATSDPQGSTELTNQQPFVEGEFYDNEQSAYNRVVLANHAIRMSFMEHLVMQQAVSLQGELKAMQEQMVHEMDVLEGARVGSILNGRKAKGPQELKKNNGT